jgi:hypothetical protein
VSNYLLVNHDVRHRCFSVNEELVVLGVEERLFHLIASKAHDRLEAVPETDREELGPLGVGPTHDVWAPIARGRSLLRNPRPVDVLGVGLGVLRFGPSARCPQDHHPLTLSLRPHSGATERR